MARRRRQRTCERFRVYRVGRAYFFAPEGMTAAEMRRAGDTYSDPYPTRQAAENAARAAGCFGGLGDELDFEPTGEAEPDGTGLVGFAVLVGVVGLLAWAVKSRNRAEADEEAQYRRRWEQ